MFRRVLTKTKSVFFTEVYYNFRYADGWAPFIRRVTKLIVLTVT